MVNDESRMKKNNFSMEQTTQDQFSQLSEVEKQIEIIKSKGLLEGVVKKMNLNLHWSTVDSNGHHRMVTRSPVSLELESPDSFDETIEGVVRIQSEKNGIEFNRVFYPLDSVIITPSGMWHWQQDSTVQIPEDSLYLEIIPVDEYVESLHSRFDVLQLEKQSPIVNLSLLDSSPEHGEMVLNEIIRYYGETELEAKRDMLVKALNFIDNRLDLVSGNLRDVEGSLQNYKSSLGITNLAAEEQIYLGQIKDNENEISNIETQIKILNDIELYLTRQNQTGGTVPGTLGLTDQVVVGMLSELFKDESEKERVLRLSGEKNPQVSILEDRIAKRKESILESVRNLRRSLETSKETLSKNNLRFNQSLRSIPQKEKVLADISRNQSVKNDLYTFLLQKREETAISLASVSPNHTVIEKAELFGRVKPKPFLVYTYGILAALILSGLWVYRKEYANNVFVYRSDIERRTNIPIVGEFVRDKDVEKNTIVVNRKTRTLIAEQFRDLRTNITYLLREKEGSKFVLVTSSMPNEGKTFLSINLAISMALSGKKTALVEFDLYQPRISLRLGIKGINGIVEFLQGLVGMEKICHPYGDVENLSIIPCGLPSESPGELIHNERFSQLFEYLGKEYEYIIIDTPCIGMVSDTKILATYSDLSLYVIRQNHTKYGLVKFMNKLSQNGTLPNLNIVFNGITIKKVPGMDYWDSYGVNGYRYNSKNPYIYSADKAD